MKRKEKALRARSSVTAEACSVDCTAGRNSTLPLLPITSNRASCSGKEPLVKAADQAVRICWIDWLAWASLAEESEEALKESIERVAQVTDGMGFVTEVEGVNAVEAWLGSLPGQAYADARRPIILSPSLGHLLPLSAVWAGPERNAYLNAAPLMLTATDGATPFRLSTHVGDVGQIGRQLASDGQVVADGFDGPQGGDLAAQRPDGDVAGGGIAELDAGRADFGFDGSLHGPQLVETRQRLARREVQCGGLLLVVDQPRVD